MKHFEQFVHDTWHGNGDLRDLYIMSTGLAGETGETLEHLKKFVRDGKLDKTELTLELGDVLHYWVRICQQFDISTDDVMAANIDKLTKRYS